MLDMDRGVTACIHGVAVMKHSHCDTIEEELHRAVVVDLVQGESAVHNNPPVIKKGAAQRACQEVSWLRAPGSGQPFFELQQGWPADSDENAAPCGHDRGLLAAFQHFVTVHMLDSTSRSVDACPHVVRTGVPGIDCFHACACMYTGWIGCLRCT